jgi:3-oxoacyl-[acyl-carrier protein] reductase
MHKERAEAWALVGGSSQGIGRAVAQVLAAQGFRVALMARRASVLEEVRAQLPKPDQHKVVAVDVEDLETLSLAIEQLVREVGAIRVWVNNTGGPKAGPLTDATNQDMERALRGHVLASQVVLQRILPGMKTQKFGRIINILSTSVKTPLPNLGVSNLVRAAMAAWAKTLSQELGPWGITVNSILPGFTATPRLEQLAQVAGACTGQAEREVLQSWAEQVPLRRVADPVELAEVVGFLASTKASYVSGVSLPVDGGRTVAL